MRLHPRSLLEVAGILGEAVAELGRDTARAVVAFFQGDGEPMVEVGPDDEQAAA